MPIITLLTDFGSKNGFTGVLKGVIWKIAPDTHIADITHEITPQNIMEGAIALWRAAAFFPTGTIHVAVVDPGVGTARRPIAAQIGDQYFVGPDNGIFTPIMEQAESKGQGVKVFHLVNPEYWLPEVSHTFHGRDIFAPVAAHLAAGVLIEKMGTPVKDPIRLVMPQPVT
jgi:S-adenosylmethionine hydrolase